jgi:multiple sugar transport system permease protein
VTVLIVLGQTVTCTLSGYAFAMPLIFLQSQDNFTIPLGLVGLQGNLGTGSISVVLAGVVLAMLPSVLLFIVAQRYFIAGVTAGSSR